MIPLLTDFYKRYYGLYVKFTGSYGLSLGKEFTLSLISQNSILSLSIKAMPNVHLSPRQEDYDV